MPAKSPLRPSSNIIDIVSTKGEVAAEVLGKGGCGVAFWVGRAEMFQAQNEFW